MTEEQILKRMAANPLPDGLSLSGGEPFDQPEGFAILARGARLLGYHVMAWSGYTFEELERDAERRTLDFPWRGSANQRLVDVPVSLAASCVMEAVL